MVAHGFSMQSLYLFEPYVDKILAIFFSKMDEFAKTQQPFDIYFWFELFTMDLMGELTFGRSFGALEAGKPARYSELVGLSGRFNNLSGVLPFGKYNVKLLSWVPLPYVQRLWRARLEYLEYARQTLEKRFLENRQQGLPSGKTRQDIMQRFIEAQDPETGHRMDFAELRAEASSLMLVTLQVPRTLLTLQGRWSIHRERHDELDGLLSLQESTIQGTHRQTARGDVPRQPQRFTANSLLKVEQAEPSRGVRDGMPPHASTDCLWHATHDSSHRCCHLWTLHPR